MGTRTYIILAVVGVVGILGGVLLRMPESLKGRGAGGYVMFRGQVRDYGKETGDYPKDARELVEKLGPRLTAAGGSKLSYVRDGLVRLEDAQSAMEVEYHYVSKDEMPEMKCVFK